MTPPLPLAPEQLYTPCDESRFEFETTAELTGQTGVVGQERALEAIDFGIAMERPGYNLFALGPAGLGKHTVVMERLRGEAVRRPAPGDWCYVHNFDDPRRPVALALPRGHGTRLRRDMEELVEALQTMVPAVFESDDYQARLHELEEAFTRRQEEAVAEVREAAEAQGIALIRTPTGFAFAPMRDDKVLGPRDFQKLDEQEQERFHQQVEQLQERLQRVLDQIPQWRREADERLKALNEEVARGVVAGVVERLREAHATSAAVAAHLDAVEADLIANIDLFRGETGGDGADPFQRYRVNVVVDNGATEGAPVIFEDNPTYQNLVGTIEHQALMGALVTDFTLIKGGALLRANGGYLVIDAFKVLQHPFAWEGLKRALASGELRITTLEQMASLVSTVSIDPQPLPLDVKVVLTGERYLYYLLHQLDPEFRRLFKVAADFEERIERSPANDRLYAGLIATLARREGLRPLDRGAVARVIEEGARWAEDAARLATHMGALADLLCEADHWAGREGHEVIGRGDVQRAIEARQRRGGRLRERILESILRGDLLIDSRGERVGQVNGLTVLDMGDISFGIPTRITARVRMGEGELIDIEREVEMAGPIHSKGVLILSGFLGQRYACEVPLALAASLVFEQSYGEVEGDSASAAELYALLSAIARVPLSQALAVTGSINQHGDIQPIGGVNEKIEGFFDLCRARGFAPGQGVVIPRANVGDLMLRADVVEAVRQGRFSIYPITTVDEGIELLTGMAAGEADAQGRFPGESFNGKVAARLLNLARIRHEFGEDKRHHDGHDHEEKEGKKE